MKAIELCTNRFDDDTKASFVDLYTKVDAGATADSIAEEQKAEALKAQQMSPMIVRTIMTRKTLSKSKSIHSVVLGRECSEASPTFYHTNKYEDYMKYNEENILNEIKEYIKELMGNTMLKLKKVYKYKTY